MAYIAKSTSAICAPQKHRAHPKNRALKLNAIIVACVFCVSPIFNAPSAAALSDEELGAISNNCSTIRQSLRQLQKSDSKTRTYLGAAYETISNYFITPLNLRLVRNNRPTFSDIQANFTNEQTKFRDNYITYMRELEGLIAIDCQREPKKFYDQLIVVRDRRAQVRLTTESLTRLTGEQYQAVTKLKQEIRP